MASTATKKEKKSVFASKLKSMRKNWTSAREEAKSSGFDNLPEGPYVGWLVDAELCESQNGRLQIKWVFKVARGDEAGRTQTSYDGLENADSLVWLGRKLARFDIDIESMELDELESILKELVEREALVRFRVKEKGEFTNVYVDRVVDPDDYDDLLGFDEKPKKSKSKSKSKSKDDDDDSDSDDSDSDDSDDADDDDSDDDDSDDDDSGDDDADDDDADDDADDDDDSEGEFSYEDIMAMSAADIKKLIKDNKLKTNPKIPLPTLRKKLVEELGLEPSDDDDDDDDSEGKNARSSKSGKKSSKKSDDEDDDDSDDDDSDDSDDDDDKEPTKGCKVLFLLKGKTTEGKVLALLNGGKKLKVKTKKGVVTTVNASEVEVDDTPF